MTPNAITTFEDNVRARLKSVVAELIPEERLDELTRAAVKEFERTDFPRLVKSMLEEQYRAAIQDEFKKPEWQERFGTSGQAFASDAVRKIIIDNAPLVLASMMGGTVDAMLQQLRYQLQSQGVPGRY